MVVAAACAGSRVCYFPLQGNMSHDLDRGRKRANALLVVPVHSVVGSLKNEALFCRHHSSCCFPLKVVRASLNANTKTTSPLFAVEVTSRRKISRSRKKRRSRGVKNRVFWLAVRGRRAKLPLAPGLTHYQPCHEEDSTVESNCPGSSGPGLAPRLGLASRGRASSRNVELNSHGGQRLGLDDERVDLSGEREGEGEGKGGRGGAGSLWHGWLFAGVFLLRLPRQFAVLVLAFERAPGPFGLGACEQHLFRARIDRSVCDTFNLETGVARPFRRETKDGYHEQRDGPSTKKNGW